MRTVSDFYREKAARTLKLAGKAKDKENKAYLLSVVEQYEKLASEADQTQRQPMGKR